VVDPTPWRLPVPPAVDPSSGDAAAGWVATHLGDLVEASGSGPVRASARFRGGQAAADRALAATDLAGYAADRNEVWPTSRRGATALSPYVRHGLLSLPQLWSMARDAGPADRDRFRDELLWQEYARHVYARLGGRTAEGLRNELHGSRALGDAGPDPWERARSGGMACLELVLAELETDGWAVNQTRMWLASHWAVRQHDGGRASWRDGEDALYRRLLDGSRAANRLGWQWTVGTGTGRPYGFSRQQVERRAPGVCGSCALRDGCPIEDWPDDPPLREVPRDPLLKDDPDPARSAGPPGVEVVDPDRAPQAVWLTAESLGDADPALQAHPDLPAVFVWDVPLLARLRLDPMRLVFLAETLGDLAQRRTLEVWRGDVLRTLGGRTPSTSAATPDAAEPPAPRPLATTFAPVPGWHRRRGALDVVELHPWPWLRRPAGGPIGSFSAWRSAGRRTTRG
jgi:deoxyribodipyrimidine photo-lyase